MAALPADDPASRRARGDDAAPAPVNDGRPPA